MQSCTTSVLKEMKAAATGMALTVGTVLGYAAERMLRSNYARPSRSSAGRIRVVRCRPTNETDQPKATKAPSEVEELRVHHDDDHSPRAHVS